MKPRALFLKAGILSLFCAAILSGCIYTSNIVFPNKNEALYCFLDPQNDESYLYRIDINTRLPELEAKFSHPITVIAVSEDKKTFFFFEIVENAEGKSDETDDTLNLKMLPMEDISNPDNAKTICSFVINIDAGLHIGASWGASSIIPQADKGIAFVHFIEQENKAILAKVDLKSGDIKTIDDGIVSYARLSPNGKYLAYVKSEKYEDEKENKEKFKSKVVVIAADTLKQTEEKDVGGWQIPPQYSFCPSGNEDYKILYPSPQGESGDSGPRGARIKLHYITSLQYVAGTNKVLIYGTSEEDAKAMGEICDMNCNICETLQCGEFLPIGWSPDCTFFFLGSNRYLAQYIVGKNIFAVYEFIPPTEEGKEPEIRSTMLKQLPEKTGERFWRKKTETN